MGLVILNLEIVELFQLYRSCSLGTECLEKNIEGNA